MRALITVISDLFTDMRVQKHAILLAEMGCSVELIGRRDGRSPLPSLQGISARRIRIPFRKGPMMYLSFNGALLLHLLFRKADLYVANDLDTLIPCYIVSRLRRKPLVYDAHEYFTGQYGLPERRIKYRLWKIAEKMVLPKVDYMITVSNSIADLYRQEYGILPVVVRNIPLSTVTIEPYPRHTTGAQEHDLVIAFQGSGINPGRGASELIEAMSLVEGIRLIIIGAGDIIDKIKLELKEKRLEQKITILPRMPWEEMMRYTRSCDAGLSLDTDTCLNQRYSLPNKLFDYIAAGIPVIVSPLPEVSALTRKYGCGIVLEDVTPEIIAVALSRLRDDRHYLTELKEKTKKAAVELRWENERIAEQELFRSVIEKKMI
jgi:glycosyltransferase involved in cell wall biosynthesis